MPPAPPLVVKLGGDALASPERLATEARRLAALARDHPVVAVASARRGVTDHLLDLVDGVRRAVGDSTGPQAEADRAVAAGELVTAALLALALNDLGVAAVSLDARQAGIRATGRPGAARIRAIAPGRLRALLARRVVPVVTGFQGWRRGRVATLGRGGTDTSAVALGVALGAARVMFVKDTEGLRTADPRLVENSQPFGDVSHAFLTALTAAGARVLHPDAARLAERHAIPLAFHALGQSAPATTVGEHHPGPELRAIATERLSEDLSRVSAVTGNLTVAVGCTDSLRAALSRAGVEIRESHAGRNGPRFLVPTAQAAQATRVLHRAFVGRAQDMWAPERLVS